MKARSALQVCLRQNSEDEAQRSAQASEETQETREAHMRLRRPCRPRWESTWSCKASPPASRRLRSMPALP